MTVAFLNIMINRKRTEILKILMHTFKHMSCDTYMEGLRQLNQMRSKELKILKFKKNKKLKKIIRKPLGK